MTNDKENEVSFFNINFDAVKTVEDVKMILKYLELMINDAGVPERIEPIRHLLVQINPFKK